MLYGKNYKFHIILAIDSRFLLLPKNVFIGIRFFFGSAIYATIIFYKTQ